MKTSVVNQPVGLYFTATPGIIDFSTLQVFNGGSVVTPSISVTEISSGLYRASLTPTITGEYALFFQGRIVSELEVVTKSVYTFLQNIEDEAIGSWTWDKQLGKLTMLRQDGTTLGQFDVVENMTTASRERI